MSLLSSSYNTPVALIQFRQILTSQYLSYTYTFLFVFTLGARNLKEQSCDVSAVFEWTEHLVILYELHVQHLIVGMYYSNKWIHTHFPMLHI